MFPSVNLNPSHYSLTLQKLYTCGVIITLKKNVQWAMNYEAIIMALITLQ